MGVKEIWEKAKTEGKRSLYGKETLSLGEFICWLIAILIVWQGARLRIPEKWRFPSAMVVILIGMLVW